MTGGKATGEALSPRVSPVRVSFSLATAPMSPACSSVTGAIVLPWDARCGKNVRSAAVRVRQVRIVLDGAGEHLEVGDPAGKWVGYRFEYVERNGGSCRRFALASLPLTFRGSGFARAGKEFCEEIHNLSVPMLCSADVHITGKMRFSRSLLRVRPRCAQRAGCLFRKTPPSVRLCLPRRLRPALRAPLGGSKSAGFRFLAFAVAIGLVIVSLHADQIDEPLKSFSAPMGS